MPLPCCELANIHQSYQLALAQAVKRAFAQENKKVEHVRQVPALLLGKCHARCHSNCKKAGGSVFKHNCTSPKRKRFISHLTRCMEASWNE
jgi:hypothetical protein